MSRLSQIRYNGLCLLAALVSPRRWGKVGFFAAGLSRALGEQRRAD